MLVLCIDSIGVNVADRVAFQNTFILYFSIKLFLFLFLFENRGGEMVIKRVGGWLGLK